MKVVRVIGGLGNQMFQYAFYLALRKRFNNVKLDIGSYKYYKLHDYQLEEIFNLKELNHASRMEILIFRFIKKWQIVKEDVFYHPEILDIKGFRYYAGYWNSENYFTEVINNVKQSFNFKINLKDKNEQIANEIKNTNSVSIHIRRGDYISSEVNRQIYGNICTLNYYTKAISKIEESVVNPSYFIFSNDIDWCKENLKIGNAKFINWNKGKDNYIDMQLMSLCKNNIIANSSFSWWAAWLNENKNKIIISPSRFFNDVLPSNPNTLIPADWYKIDV
jgi:hypothetical protein